MQYNYIFVSNTKTIIIINRLILLSIQIKNINKYKRLLNFFILNINSSLSRL